MKFFDNVYAVDVCIYLPDINTIIISDLHIGYEESLGKQGVLVPRLQYKQLIKKLDWVLSQVKVDKVVFNGDIKHEFGTISKQEWRELLRLIDYFLKKNIEIVVVKGNHDTILGPIAKTRNIREYKEIRHNGILITHGDYVPEKLEKTIIIGHEHPAITLKEGAKQEKFKCFLKGKFKKSTLIVQPSMNPLIEGTDVSKEQFLSPFLKELSMFEVFVVNEKSHEILSFGKLINFRDR